MRTSIVASAIVLQSILALVFVIPAAAKFTPAKMQVDNFNRYCYPQWFCSATWAVEAVGSIGMVVGVWVDKLAIAAGFWLTTTIIGAVYTDLFRRGSASPIRVVAHAIVLCCKNVRSAWSHEATKKKQETG